MSALSPSGTYFADMISHAVLYPSSAFEAERAALMGYSASASELVNAVCPTYAPEVDLKVLAVPVRPIDVSVTGYTYPFSSKFSSSIHTDLLKPLPSLPRQSLLLSGWSSPAWLPVYCSFPEQILLSPVLHCFSKNDGKSTSRNQDRIRSSRTMP